MRTSLSVEVRHAWLASTTVSTVKDQILTEAVMLSRAAVLASALVDAAQNSATFSDSASGSTTCR